MKEQIISFFKNILYFILSRKIAFSAMSVMVALSVTAASIVVADSINSVPKKDTISSSSEEETVSDEPVIPIETPSEEPVSSTEVSSSVLSSATAKPQKKPTATSSTSKAPVISGTGYKYNSNMSPDNNIFLDALIYTGYNIEKHRADGNMCKYVLSGQKRGLGYLSKIGYSGGSTGYETNASGKPDIAKFERSGLVCASFATYVYFNYLPNVAGIDTSSLTRPKSSVFANDWYTAVKDWVKKGYSEYIPFTSKVTGATGNSFIVFNPSREIPIGSVIIFRNPKKAATYGAHVAIYAGTVNSYHWLLHVGTANGPEFSAVERMNFGPNPRWPIAIVTPPSNIRFSPVIEIELKDDLGAPISGVQFSLKNSGGTTVIGTTDANGKIVKSDLTYGQYELIQTVPTGYTCENPTQSIMLNTLKNSYNKITVTDIKDKPPVEEEPAPETPDPENPDGGSNPPDGEDATPPESGNKKPDGEGTDGEDNNENKN